MLSRRHKQQIAPCDIVKNKYYLQRGFNVAQQLCPRINKCFQQPIVRHQLQQTLNTLKKTKI